LAAQPLILTDQALSLAHFRSLFAARGLAPRIAHRPASADLMRSFAAHGLGIGLGYSRPLPDAAPDGRPLAIRPILDAGSEALVLAHAPANPLPPAALRLAEALPGLLRVAPAPAKVAASGAEGDADGGPWL
jgi:DNA-binding transcriptional LysR family regulator